MPDGYLIQIVNGKAGLASLEPEIEQLAANASHLNPFFAPEWLDAWNSQVGMVYNPVLLTVRNGDGELAGFWPFVEQPAIFGKGLWPMGYHMADYLDPLYLHEEPILRVRLIEGLDQLLNEHRFIWLPLLRKEFAQDYLRPYFARKRQPILFAPGATRHFIEFGEQSVEELLQSALGSKSRKTLRYTRKKMEEMGNLEFRVMSTQADVEKFLPEFELIEDASWKSSEDTGLFHHLGMREFYKQLLPVMAGSGRVQLS
ncbi:MAG: GNAT family N-acetyltransferase, partial [Opitutae bacterium]|nr:GNAT family N-acetyltransferase [Opitutae bacterium]